MLHSNDFVAIHLTDISAAENYYTNVMKFEMVSRTEKSVAYNTGSFLLNVCADLNQGLPIPSFPVRDIRAAKEGLIANGCTILRDEGGSLCFSDPFGVIYHVVEEDSNL
jgi:catechol 2,3-dioxygenase-like lactoylglutathione lyase family enzyme